jgi:hypothetical protein
MNFFFKIKISMFEQEKLAFFENELRTICIFCQRKFKEETNTSQHFCWTERDIKMSVSLMEKKYRKPKMKNQK